MKKIASLTAALLALMLLLCACGSTDSGAAEEETADAGTGKQTASAWLSEEDTDVRVTIDLTGGWSVDFARGAFYLYDGENVEGKEAVAIGIMLSKEVYDEHMADAEASDSLREVEGGVAFTREDYEAYLFTVTGSETGKEGYFLLNIYQGADGDAIYGRVLAEVDDFSTDPYGPSDLYTAEELDAAAIKIAEEFSTWNGCEMLSITYAGDECNSEENIQWVNETKEGKNYTQCVEFLTDFHSPTDEADLEGTAWEPDTDYTDYQWWLAREDGGDWELVSWGY